MALRSLLNRLTMSESTAETLAIINQLGAGDILDLKLAGVIQWTFDDNGNLVPAGAQTVDGVDVGTEVPLNTTHSASDGKDHSDVVLNTTHRGSSGSADHSDIGANTTHRGSDGKDHSDVVLNTTHRGSSGSADHSDIGANTTHSASDGKDHSDVVLNNTHRASDGSGHADVALNTTHRGLTNDPHATVSDTHPPTATEAFSGEHTFDYLEFFNGTIEQTIDIDIVEAAGTVSLELQAEGGGDLTLNFSDGHHAFDATDPVASVALTNGTDTVPVKNWVYILQSNDTLTASAVGWPTAEHAPIATVVVQSAASVSSSGAYAVQSWTDHIKDANDQGHQTDIADWIRGQHATWKSGVAPTLTFDTGPTPDTVIFTSTTGEVYQLHPHDFPAFTGTPDIRVFNEPGTPYNVITDINQLTQDSEGNAFTNNDYFTITIWGYVSEDAADCKLFLNLPSGVYGNSTAALLDSSMFTNTSIPIIYKGGAFLIARYTLRYQTAGSGTFSLVAGGEVDLRGQPPGTSTGGGAGGGSSLTVEEQDASPSVPDVNTIKFPNGSVTDDGGGIVSVAISATDSAAIHDNIAAEISAITEKVTPISGDFLLIEDSAAADVKNRVQIGNLPGAGGTDADAIHDNVAGEIVLITEKATPVSADVIVIEDSAAANAKKRVQIGNLPGDGRYVPRGEVSAVDFAVGDLTTNGVLQDLDLGAIVPAGAIAVQLKVFLVDGAANSFIQFREKGDANAFVGQLSRTVVASIPTDASYPVACDANRELQYLTSNLTFTSLDITVQGWYF